MNYLEQNFKSILKITGLNVSQLARRTSISQPVIHRITSGKTDNPRINTLIPVAQYLNLTLDQLIGSEPLSSVLSTQPIKMQKPRFIPLLLESNILSWLNESSECTHRQKVVVDFEISSRAFAVRHQGSTMEPRFPDKTLLIIDPHCTPKHEDYVLVYLKKNKVFVFRQFLIKDHCTHLKSCSDSSVVMRPEDLIVGVMLQARLDQF